MSDPFGRRVLAAVALGVLCANLLLAADPALVDRGHWPEMIGQALIAVVAGYVAICAIVVGLALLRPGWRGTSGR